MCATLSPLHALTVQSGFSSQYCYCVSHIHNLELHAPKQLVSAALIACHFTNLIIEIRSGLLEKSFFSSSLRLCQIFSLFRIIDVLPPGDNAIGSRSTPYSAGNRTWLVRFSTPKLVHLGLESFLSGQLSPLTATKYGFDCFALMMAFVFGHPICVSCRTGSSHLLGHHGVLVCLLCRRA